MRIVLFSLAGLALPVAALLWSEVVCRRVDVPEFPEEAATR